MIATVTLNPALDRTIYVRGLVVGDTNRVERTELDAGGKGVNASRMLAVLGAETVALGFIGGRTGAFISHVLSDEGIQPDFIETQAQTRTNTDIQDMDGSPPTALNEYGGPITADELDMLTARVRYWASMSSFVIIGGSIPQGVGPEIYRQLITVCHEEGARVVLDADGEPLALGLQAHPMMVKPNLDEAERLCGRRLPTLDDIVAAAQEIAADWVEIAVVSMGKRGAVAAASDGVWHVVPPDVKAVSTIGSGDSMVAGMALALSEGRPLAEALRLGAAAGAATAMSSGVEIGTKADVQNLLPSVVVRPLR
jgi:1-phosphofructokinase family hexose kinase